MAKQMYLADEAAKAGPYTSRLTLVALHNWSPYTSLLTQVPHLHLNLNYLRDPFVGVLSLNPPQLLPQKVLTLS